VRTSNVFVRINNDSPRIAIKAVRGLFVFWRTEFTQCYAGAIDKPCRLWKLSHRGAVFRVVMSRRHMPAVLFVPREG